MFQLQAYVYVYSTLGERELGVGIQMLTYVHISIHSAAVSISQTSQIEQAQNAKLEVDKR
jgi:hypothetical protein